MHINFLNKKLPGFTVIELLISITIVAIISGATLTTINTGKSRDKARDSVKGANLEKIKIALESYYATSDTGTYPISSSDAEFSNFITWPGAKYVYTRPTPSSYFVYVASSADPTAILKFSSTWPSFKTCFGGDADKTNISACAASVNAAAVCGDFVCNGTETCTSCAGDCGTCVTTCGDLVCNGTETCSTCAGDCGACAPVCGDHVCNGTETCSTCAGDCGACAPVCGDHVCNGTETCSTCAGDCGACAPVCGDHVCNGTETCSTCSGDCGACAPVCGDHTCNGTETCSTCSGDCGACAAVCGDDICNGFETCSSCSVDCGACVTKCGNRICDSGESCYNCPIDCGRYCIEPPPDYY